METPIWCQQIHRLPRGFLKPTHPLCLAKCGPHAGSPSNWCPRLASASSALQRDSPEEICTKTTCSVFWNTTFSNHNIIIYIYIYIIYNIYIYLQVQHNFIQKLQPSKFYQNLLLMWENNNHPFGNGLTIYGDSGDGSSLFYPHYVCLPPHLSSFFLHPSPGNAIPGTTRPRATPATMPLTHTRQSTPPSCAVWCHGSDVKVPGGIGTQLEVWKKNMWFWKRQFFECQCWDMICFGSF